MARICKRGATLCLYRFDYQLFLGSQVVVLPEDLRPKFPGHDCGSQACRVPRTCEAKGCIKDSGIKDYGMKDSGIDCISQTTVPHQAARNCGVNRTSNL